LKAGYDVVVYDLMLYGRERLAERFAPSGD